MEKGNDEEKLNILLTWAAQHGVTDDTNPSSATTHPSSSCLRHSLVISNFPEAGGRGLAAVRKLRKGELILSVPKSVLLTRDNVLTGDPKLSLAVMNHLSLASSQILAVCLLWEMGKKRTSKWYPYLKNLPRCYYTLSSFCQFQIQMLQVDDAIWTAERAVSKAESDWKGAISLMKEVELKPQFRTLKAWLWASATLSSRTLHIQWDDAGCLCPVGDLFNYAAPGDEQSLCQEGCDVLDEDHHVSNDRHFDPSDSLVQRLTDGGFNETNATYCFYARENYKKGEQVLLGYGLYTNLELLEHYGFLLTNNPNDKVYIPLLHDMTFSASWSRDLIYIDHSGKPSFALLSTLRVWATPVNQRKSVSHLVYSGLQLSNQNEIIVMKWLVKKCHDILKALPTTIEEDSLLIQTIDNAQNLGDLMTIQPALESEVKFFLKLHNLPEGNTKAKLCDKLNKYVETWKLSILWRHGYKKILHKCINYCTEILQAFET